MAEKEIKNNPKDMVEAVPEEVEKLEADIAKKGILEGTEVMEPAAPKFTRTSYAERRAQKEAEAKQRALETWVPKTELGKEVKHGKIKSYNEVVASGKKVLEVEIIDTLLPNLQSDLILIGQAKGKFGGGKRRAWKQTQKKAMEGNIISFACMSVVGNKDGLVGIGYGKASETLPARAKALRFAKLNLVKITRGFESPESDRGEPHTIPFTVEGRCGSVRIKLMPAPRGTGLVAGDECKKLLRLAGIKDIYSQAIGEKRTSFNMVKACLKAMLKTNEMKL